MGRGEREGKGGEGLRWGRAAARARRGPAGMTTHRCHRGQLTRVGLVLLMLEALWGAAGRRGPARDLPLLPLPKSWTPVPKSWTFQYLKTSQLSPASKHPRARDRERTNKAGAGNGKFWARCAPPPLRSPVVQTLQQLLPPLRPFLFIALKQPLVNCYPVLWHLLVDDTCPPVFGFAHGDGEERTQWDFVGI